MKGRNSPKSGVGVGGGEMGRLAVAQGMRDSFGGLGADLLRLAFGS